jgi:hypothetical protein
LPDECVRDCSSQGSVDESVAHWAKELRKTIHCSDIRPDPIRAELKEYGAWDEEELTDDEANWRRLIWIAACNIKEEEHAAKQEVNDTDGLDPMQPYN